jgi:hypothetical protein
LKSLVVDRQEIIYNSVERNRLFEGDIQDTRVVFFTPFPSTAA